ncbi:MAG: FtsX-like permease family protein [Ardenticatenaceae bacterium]|nr:FtsX-like permease family protein [Ardenticatenaceae bacterium]
MMAPRWRKVLRDLWGNKTRTILVVLSIAVGVFALGMIMGTNIMLNRDLPEVYATINPPHAVLFSENFDENLLAVVEDIDGVEAVTAKRNFRAAMQIGPDEWTDIEMTFFTDMANTEVGKIFPVEGAWPPSGDSLLVERASLPYTNAEIGDRVLIETRSGRQRWVEIAGTAHDINTEPVQFSNTPNTYASMSLLDSLGIDREFDELHIRVISDVPGEEPSEAYVKEVASEIRDKIERGDREVFWVWYPVPGEHPATEAINPLLYILGVLGGFSLFLSGFLVVNIINGLLTQHVKQIGIMKAIGARSNQVFVLYIITVVIFGLLSLFIAVPLGGVAAYGFASYLASLINFDLSGFYIPLNVIAIQIGVAVGVPVLAALVPVIQGARISVREAISDEGMGRGKFGTHILDRIMSWWTISVLRLQRPMAISLRNTIRRKARLFLTLFTMTLGGAIFISVISIYASLLATLDDALSYFNYDVDINFNKSYRIAEIQRAALEVDGVEAAESWIGETVRRVADDGSEGENLVLLGIPPESITIRPTVTEGRWLEPGDTNAIVINTSVLQQETDDIQVGDTIILKTQGEEKEWVVVGFVRSVMVGPLTYANQDYLARELNFVGRSGGVQIIGTDHDPAAQQDLADRLETFFDQAGLEVASTGTISETREQIIYQFNIIVTLLTVMAILIAVVGGLGLMGTMSINVMERTREVGVMRAVGASDRSVLRVVLVEGVFIGLLSWAMAALISYPLGRVLSDAVGNALMQSPLTYRFALNGAFGWVVAVVIIASLASYLPARRASRVSVRETLAYE